MKNGFLIKNGFEDINVQDPLPCDGDSVYIKDVDFDNSDFTGWVGDPELLFRSPFSESIVNSSGDNPKQIILAFKRTIRTSEIGFGENNGGNFGNIKITKLGSGGFDRGVYDDSNKDEQLTSLVATFGNESFNSLKIEFFTSNPVSLSNITIPKAGLTVIGNKVASAIPVSIDSVYSVDLDLETSSSAGFNGGNINDLISYSGKVLVNSSTDNPKILIVDLIRPIQTSILGLATSTGDFSNVKMSIGFGDVPGTEEVIYDGSADNTKRQLLIPDIPPLTFSTLKIEFFTTDPVSINSVGISKSTQTISRIQGQTPDGKVANVRLTKSENLRTTDAESGLAIAKGDVDGTTFIHKFGNAPSFSTGDGVVSIWDAADGSGSAQYQYNYSATDNIDSISSSNNGDTQQIEIQGLDANYELVNQVVILVGQTTQILTTPLLRVFRMKNIGSSDLLGDVFLYINGSAVTGGIPNVPANIRAGIEIPNNQTLMAIYTVPAGKTAYFRDWYAATAAGNKNATYKLVLKARPFNQVFQTKHISSISDIGTNAYQHKYEEPEVFEEKTDVEMTVELLSTGVAGASVSAGFDIVLVDNE